MDSILQDIFRWLPSGWIYYLMIGLISFLESLAAVGIFVPGSVLIVFAGFLAANGKGLFLPLFMVATAGAIVGDALSYALGARMGASLMRRPIFRKRAALLQKAEIFFVDHGGKSVFIGRFVGFLRPFIPYIAGYARMRPGPFTFYVIVSGLLWGAAYPGLGYVFGASWKLVQVWTGRFSLLIAALVVGFIVNALLWRWVAPRILRLCSHLGRLILRRWQQMVATEAMQSFIARHPRLCSFVGNRFRPGHSSGLYLTLGFFLSTLFALAFAWLAANLKISDALVDLDRRIYEIVPLLRHSFTDTFFLLLTYLGDWPVLLSLAVPACLWLLMHHRDFSAFIVAVGTAAGQALVFILKSAYSRPRPEPFFTSLGAESWAFPSAHAFVAAVFYGLIVYICLDAVTRWRTRFALITAGSFLALLIGASRIYLGVHWFSDVLGGFALAALWLTFLITARELRRRTAEGFPWRKGIRLLRVPRRVRPWLLAVAVAGALTTTGMYMGRQLQQDLASQSPPSPPKILERQTPEQIGAALPTRTEDLGGKKLRPLSMIVFAEKDALVGTLESSGWQRARTPSFAAFRDRFVNLESGQTRLSAPVMPMLVDGSDPDLSFAHPVERQKPPQRLTVLIWGLDHRLSDGRRAWGVLASRCTALHRFLSIALPLPVLASDVDRQRDALVRDLTRLGVVERRDHIDGRPEEGVDAIGNPFRTDGDIALLWLR
ncbi:MAG: phosphatase PAP2 family protein, partial [Desulfuromonadales bacterium]|nr:phosphatase PAP2 family protein [Desulfuromonadales bacterium]NIS40287.1 phosphatase PAP2 family protein [Desulfuromonadales bacterium]